MAAKQNIDLVNQLFAGFGSGNIDSVLSVLSHDISWESPPMDNFLGGTHTGHDGVRKFISNIYQNLQVLQFQALEFIADSDNVVVLGYDKSTYKSTGLTYETNWIQVYTITNGKISRMREQYDTAAVLAALK